MNRRKAMGAMVGGVAAAPQALKMAGQAMQQTGTSRFPPSLAAKANYGQEAQPISMEDQRKHLLQRKEQIEALLRGEIPYLDGPPMDRRHMASAATHSIESLRSVSAQHKSTMLHDLDTRRQLEVSRWHWRNELEGIEQSIASWGKLFS